jgi:hypothetical protein
VGQGVEVHDLSALCLHRLRPSARAADDDIGVNVVATEEERQDRKGRSVMPAQRRQPVDWQASNVRVAQLGVGGFRSEERRENWRVGKRPQHGNEHSLAAAPLDQVVVDERHPRSHGSRRY